MRFLKESSATKTAWYPELDHLDLQVRAETLKARSEPCMLQLCVVPAYGEHRTENLLRTPSSFLGPAPTWTTRGGSLPFNNRFAPSV